LALHIFGAALLNTHALYLMQNEKGMSLPDFKWVSSECFWKMIKKEESHLGVEGVHVGKFLNI
jgi:hypothetical protein